MDIFDILNGFFVYLIIWGTMSYLIGYATKTSMWWTFFFGILGTIIGVILKYNHDTKPPQWLRHGLRLPCTSRRSS